MVHLPAGVRGERKKQPHSLHACHRRENFLEVHAFSLHIAFRHQVGLVLDDLAIQVALAAVHPLQTDGFVACRQVGEFPSVILTNGRHLTVHRRLPGAVVQRLTDVARLLRREEAELELFSDGLIFSLVEDAR